MLLTRLHPAIVKPKQFNKHNHVFYSLNETTSTFKVTLAFWYVIRLYSKVIVII